MEGHDTCRKIAILTAMATGKEVNYEDIYTEGITRITDIDFKYAEKMGTSVKLFGTSRIKDGRVLAYVAPGDDQDQSLYSVNDVFNGIFSKGQYAGDLHVLRQRRRKSFPQAARWWLISLKRPRILKGTCPWAGPGKNRPLNPWTRHSSGTLSGWPVPTAIRSRM